MTKASLQPTFEDKRLSYKQTKDVDRYIGLCIQTIRKARKISQKELLYRLNKPLQQQALSRYENGITPIPAALLFDISQALGVTVETFMPLDGEGAYELGSDQKKIKQALNDALKVFAFHFKSDQTEIAKLETLLNDLSKK